MAILCSWQPCWSLHSADFNVEFENLRIEDFVTVYDRMITSRRQTKYAQEQKARRLRIGFEALRGYRGRDNRHLFLVEGELVDSQVLLVLGSLRNVPEHILELDSELNRIPVRGWWRNPRV